MKKIIYLFFLIFSLAIPVLAATTDFTANGDITVANVTFGATTADMLIMNGSTAESWTYTSGAFTVTNPGTFKVGSADTAVKSVKATQGDTAVACAENTIPGTNYLTFPTAAGTYAVTPSSTTDCTSLCDSVANAATYNSFPTCGAATCSSGYSLSGTGANATCIAVSGGIPISLLKQINDANKPKITIINETTNNTTTNPIQPQTIPTPKTTAKIEYTIEEIKTEAKIIDTYSADKIAEEMNQLKDNGKEEEYKKLVEERIIQGADINSDEKNEIVNFITYGTQSTKKIGAGERAGTINSFKTAFNKIPQTEADWNDVIKIANGRWPSQKSKSSEERASVNFERVYKRKPDMKNKKDETAITVMAYGLRPAKRNLNSEKQAIDTFKKIYKYSPEKSTAWDVVRAVAYSGTKR